MTASFFEENQPVLKIGYDDIIFNRQAIYISMKKYLEAEITDMTEFCFKFIDARLGLYFVANSPELYCKILNDFVKMYSNFTINLEDKTTIHTLKGLTATIGATKLNKIVEQLELSADSALLAVFYEELQLVINDIQMNNIKTFNDKKQQETKQLLSLKKQKQLFEQLQLAITKRRPQRCQPILIEIESYQLNQQQQPIFNEVKQFIEAYQFNDAMDLLAINLGMCAEQTQ